MKKLFFTILLLLSAAGAGLGVYNLYGSAPTAGAFNPTGGGTYTLKGSIGSTNTSIVLSSFLEPISNIPYTMTYLNSDIEYATLAPQTTQNEFISFTGITQNADGSATLTGVTRGLERSYPYAASTTLRLPHPGQSQLILGNTPQFYNEFAKRRSNEWITGVWGFAALPTTTVVCTSQYQFCNKQYIDSSVSAGAAPAGYTVPGIGFIATQSQAASSTASTTYNAVVYPNIITANIATDTPNSATAASRVLMSDLTGKLKQGWLDLTQAFSLSGIWTFTKSLVSTGTTTISASNINTNPIVLNGLAYTFPSTRAGSSTVLSVDANGNTTWVPDHQTYSAYSTTGATASNAYATTTLIGIPANVLNASSTIEVRGAASCGYVSNSGGTCTIRLRDSTGVTFGSFTITSRSGSANGSDGNGMFSFTVLPVNSVASQQTIYNCSIFGIVSTAVSGCNGGGSAGTSVVNLAAATTLAVVIQSPSADTSASVSGLTVLVHQ